jgi:hypothetical protein
VATRTAGNTAGQKSGTMTEAGVKTT